MTKVCTRCGERKRRAHGAVTYAIKRGKLIREPCEVCGTTAHVVAHHDDYSKPLSVRWLCRGHHAQHHREERLNG